MGNIFSLLEQLESEYVTFWADICNIESPSDCKQGVDEVGAYLSRWAENRGFKVERHAEEVSGDVIAITMNENAEGRPIILSGHLDTVQPVGSFGYPAVKISDGIIYGPGVCDCKGGIVAAAYAMDALYRSGYVKRPIMLLLQSDEEVSSKYSNKRTIEYICNKAKDAEAFVNLEAYTNGKVTITRKGTVNLTFEIKGIEAHSSKCADNGASAILEAAHKIIEMEKLKDSDGITCNCGIVKGGTTANTVAGYCEFVADIRFSNDDELKYAIRYAKNVSDKSFVKGTTCTLVETNRHIAMEFQPRNKELLDRINAIFADVGLPILEQRGSAGASDAAEVTASKIPCLDSLGVEGGNYHSPNEYALISSLMEAAKRIIAIAEGL